MSQQVTVPKLPLQGGIFSFIALLVAALFFGLFVFGVPFQGINELAVGLFCWAIAFVLERVGF